MPIELDVFIPNLSLAFEYQVITSNNKRICKGEQHHRQVSKGKDLMPFTEARERTDIFKQDACKKLGIDLIAIPFWWDQVLFIECNC